MKDRMVKIHLSTGNTEWNLERYTDVWVTQSEVYNAVDTPIYI